MKFFAVTLVACVASVLAQYPTGPPQFGSPPTGVPAPGAWSEPAPGNGWGSSQSWDGEGSWNSWSASESESAWAKPTGGWDKPTWDKPSLNMPPNGTTPGWNPSYTPSWTPSSVPRPTPLQYQPGPNAAGMVGVSISMVAGAIGLVGLALA